jgi:hypothetical protein
MAVLGATSLTGCDSIPGFIAAGTKTVFEMATSPVSWTKDTAKNQSTLRVVSGSVSPGGSVPFTTIFTPAFPVSTSTPSEFSPSTTSPQTSTLTYSPSPAGPASIQPASVGGPQIVAHSHPYNSWSGAAHFLRSGSQNQGGTQVGDGTGVTGGNGGHTHSLTGTDHIHSPSSSAHFMTFTPAPHNHPFSASLDFGIQYVDMIVASKD